MEEEKSTTGYRKYKRGRRKKGQKNYQEEQKDRMIEQLERRFQNTPSTSSSSPTKVCDIPLPSEVSSPTLFAPTPQLTEKDYEVDYMTDPSTFDTHSAEIMRSDRIIKKAVHAENYMISRANTSVESVLDDFRKRLVQKTRELRSQQVEVPRIEYSRHPWTDRRGKKEDNDTSQKSEDVDDGQISSDSSEESEEEVIIRDDMDEETKRKIEAKQQRKKVKIEEKQREGTRLQQEIERKQTHPNAFGCDVPFNEKGLGNDGPECRCPLEAVNSGIRHGFYPGDDKPLKCSITDAKSLHHYFLRVNPMPNEDQTCRTGMQVNGDEYLFEGFSFVTHSPLPDCMTQRPMCKCPLDYEYELVEEEMPENCFYSEDSVELYEYIFHDLFEMLDFDLFPKRVTGETCPVVHIMPRFTFVKDGVVHLWSTKTVLAYLLLKAEIEMFSSEEIQKICSSHDESISRSTQKIKQTILFNPLFKPSSIRADWFEKDSSDFVFIHNSVRHRFSSPKTGARILFLERELNRLRQSQQTETDPDSEYLELQTELYNIKHDAKNKKCRQLRKSVEGFRDSGFKPDSVAHVVMAILACHHIRYNYGISEIEKRIDYVFNDRKTIELALMHSTFKSNYGTSNDHVRTLLNNCGYRRRYGGDDKREKKKGIVSMFNLQSGPNTEKILHNERLEYLGDAVVELIASHHLYFLFPHHAEGGLATYRTALVQNRNLAKLAMNCGFDELIQFSHGAELCTQSEFKHALANCFEAMMAAVYLDGGMDYSDKIFSSALYGDDPSLKEKWDHVNEHELKREDPLGDRELSNATPDLKNFHKLEEMTGIRFNNIRLLAKAFTRRNTPKTELTKGHNQRLEWLGDSVLQLFVSDYLFRHFPFHHEGHMSLLRTSLVSNETQAIICDELGFPEFVMKNPQRESELKMKDKADLVEAFIGALYVDQGVFACRTFIRIVFIPRLRHYIQNELWNDAKSHLQQWCLLLRDPGSAPEMPEYRVLGVEGPTNNRIYNVAVYFKNRRLASVKGTNTHKAELKVAEQALVELEKARHRMHRGKNRISRSELGETVDIFSYYNFPLED